MNRVDRAPGVRLVTDSPHVRTAPPEPPVEPFDFDAARPDRPRLVALHGRLYGGLGVQALVDLDTSEAFITLTLNGATETFDVPREKLNDAFWHPFAYGGTLHL